MDKINSRSSMLAHHVGNRLLKPIEGQLKHGKDLLDNADGAGVGPFIDPSWIYPDGAGKVLGYEP